MNIVPVTVTFLCREDDLVTFKKELIDFFLNADTPLWRKPVKVGPPVRRLSGDQRDTFGLKEDK